ncbi:MAG: DUF721 domain-containing protein [Stellaceae bacterium]
MGQEQRGRTRAIGAMLPDIAGRALGRHGLGEAQLLQHWPAIVGDRIAAGSTPRRLSFARAARRDGTLRLAVAPALALEIQHDEPVLLERINGFFGYRAVARLTLEQTWTRRQEPPARRRPLAAAERQALDAAVGQIGDDGLRAALVRLGAAIRTSRP